MSNRVCILFLVALICLSGEIIAQERYSLEVRTSPGKLSPKIGSNIDISYPDSISVVRKLEEILATLRSEGYLLAELSRLEWNKRAAIADLQLGNRIKTFYLNQGNIMPQVWGAAGYSQADIAISSGNQQHLDQLIERLLQIYEDIGYPFASLNMDSVQVGEEQIRATLVAVPGQFFEFDTLQIVGDVKVSRIFLESFLDMKSGMAYRESSLKATEARLRELPFLTAAKKPLVKFAGNKAKVTLFLQRKNSNQFDGILGLLPDNATGKLQFTGDLKLHIDNPFKRAETFDFNFRGLPRKGKELGLGLGLAELFSSPLGMDGRFNLYRQDTSFQNISAQLAVRYRIPKGYFSVFVRSRSGLPINTDTLSQEIPDFGNVRLFTYGAGLLFNSLNSNSFPTRGRRLDLDAEAGRKKVSALAAMDGEPAFRTRTAQYRMYSAFEAYLPFSARGVLKLSNRTGLLLGKDLFENELYRIGGFGSLRGFNEQSILASNYSILDAEYRFLIEQSSFLFAFANGAAVGTRTMKIERSDFPVGFGAGISLQIKTGIFSLSYALGKAKDIPLNLQDGKIHFGLITLF